MRYDIRRRSPPIFAEFVIISAQTQILRGLFAFSRCNVTSLHVVEVGKVGEGGQWYLEVGLSV